MKKSIKITRPLHARIVAGINGTPAGVAALAKSLNRKLNN
jgi:hypothetical protein